MRYGNMQGCPRTINVLVWQGVFGVLLICAFVLAADFIALESVMSQDLCEGEPHAILEGASHHVTSPSNKLRAESAQRKCISESR